MNFTTDFLKKIQFLLLLFVVASLPFFTVLNSELIILFALVTILIFYKHGVKFRIDQNFFTAIVFASLFLIYLIVIAFQQNFDFLFILEKKFSLALFPIFFWLGGTTLSRSQYNQILMTFALSTFIAALIPFWGRLDLYWENSIWRNNAEIIWRLTIHRPYFGLYALMSAAICFYLIFSFQSKALKFIFVLVAVYFLYFSLLIFTKMAIIASIISILVCLICYLLFEKKYKSLKMLTAFGVVSFALVLYYNNTLNAIFFKAITFKSFESGYNELFFSSFNTRYTIWSCCWDLIKEKSILFGAGIDNQGALDVCNNSNWIKFGNRPNEFLEKVSFNAHNDYLQYWLDTGMIGFLCIIIVFVLSIRKALTIKNYLYLFFVVLFLICGFTESLLMRQKGIVFFAFFNSMFSFAYKS